MRRLFAVFPLIAFAACAAFYLLGLYVGAFTLIGYQSGSERHQGWSTTRWFGLDLRLPVLWLDAGAIIRADFEVDARNGSLTMSVDPPIYFRTSLQTATAYVDGERQGSVAFVVQESGWYEFGASPSVLGGPRCPEPPNLAKSFLGLSKCVGYDVDFRVHWRLADAREVAGLPRLSVPRKNETLVTLRIN